MKKKTILFAISLLTVGSVFSQTLPEGMVSLLPEGVTANIGVETKGTKLKDLVVAGNKTKGYLAFFAASDAANGEELWVTNGTPAGTKMVKDIWAGSSSSNINYMTRFGDKVVFGADDGVNGMELWISDGTATGTVLVSNIHEFASSEPRGFVQLNETQFVFTAKTFDSENYDTARGAQWWLYVSDGTEAGTKLISECDTRFPGTYAATYVTPYCRVGRKVFFKADLKEGGIGDELWVTDGTAAGTKLIKDLNTEVLTTGTGGSGLDQFVNFYNEKLFFKAFTIEYGAEPWASDGTTEGTYLIKDTDPTFTDTGSPRSGNVSTPGVKPYKGKVYYRGFDPLIGTELSCTNLESGDYTTFDINKNIPTNTSSGVPDPGVEFDGVYMGSAQSGSLANTPNNFGGEMHYCDGTSVVLQSDRAPGTLNHFVKDAVVVSGSLYWWNPGAAVPEDKEKLFRIDNKDQFPVRITEFNPSGDKIHTLRNLGGDLIFTTSDTKLLYNYHYRKAGFNPATETDNLELEFRTRAEIANTSGLKDSKGQNKGFIYPNPTTDKFNFEIAGEVVNVKILDLTGRVVMEQTNLLTNSVNISTLTKGLYKVIINSTESNFISSLIIK